MLALSESAKNEALIIARETLEVYLISGKVERLYPQSEELNQNFGCFVTLKKGEDLRGCLGEFKADIPLYQLIQRLTIASASEDPRFPPVTATELKDLKIEISVLGEKKKITDWEKIKLGIEGVVIEKGSHAGTFLPQVATETGWNLEEFLYHLCWDKAGLPADAYKDPSANIYTFTAQVFEEK